ncbi:MAG: hypothetical protein A2406_04445 [Candidatus Komeilibacteria bacterium RIFOXYC1_FULL_37_11]|uniref:PrgI family protein n=1 Tax=Candidatus Komeilibacteria bacterium RIFOXYC1_FULL_37_11 TaxID=1798555 RepID=A0A1G2BWY2_9BACT|nr:MAG: hypothetical protein A2406_04445 [Candidatus Komeilibacteria bacterium RIFOXYC1_FULL_37_11]OGY95741.1 MAG: hypothetical protein A2611_03090 [Candidatus Komeilibacteria bacterium RIFOXYD1_FULL_37_29]
MPERFIVPQFIDTEDKIWGPITVRQFVIILAGLLFGFIAYKLSDFSLFIFWVIFIAFFVGVFAFYKVNGAPFHTFALNFIDSTFKKPALRVWHKEYIKVQEFKSKKENQNPQVSIAHKQMVSSRKLSELSLIIDTGGVYKGEKQANEEHWVGFSNKKIND